MAVPSGAAAGQAGAPRPHPALRALDRLVGTWDVSGPDIRGHVRFEWMEGGFFLIQQVDLVHRGRRHKGVEYIGYDADRDALTSHYFGNTDDVLAYTWEIDGDTLRVWFGWKGSPSFGTATIAGDGATASARWRWPGGGFDASMTRAA